MANHGKALLGSYLMVIVFHSDVLKRELLLVNGQKGQIAEPESLLGKITFQ